MLVLAQIPAWLTAILVAIFLFVSILMILAVLIQRPAGGGLSGAFGSGAGSGQTAFGAKTGDALTIATIAIFTIYLLFAIGLNYATRPSFDIRLEPEATGTNGSGGAGTAPAPAASTGNAPGGTGQTGTTGVAPTAPTGAPGEAPAMGTPPAPTGDPGSTGATPPPSPPPASPTGTTENPGPTGG